MSECIICKETNTTRLSNRICDNGHYIHYYCGDQWLQIAQNCPYCTIPVRDTVARVFRRKGIAIDHDKRLFLEHYRLLISLAPYDMNELPTVIRDRNNVPQFGNYNYSHVRVALWRAPHELDRYEVITTEKLNRKVNAIRNNRYISWIIKDQRLRLLREQLAEEALQSVYTGRSEE